MTAAESKEIEDDRLETLLDAVDARTARQRLLHSTISNGFMSLARERYRDPSSIERLSHRVHDHRKDVKSNVLVLVDDKVLEGVSTQQYSMFDDSNCTWTRDSALSLRRRNLDSKAKSNSSCTTTGNGSLSRHHDVRNSVIAVPSAEVREAIGFFRAAIDQAIEMASADAKVRTLLDGIGDGNK